MKHRTFHLVLLIGLVLSGSFAYGQVAPGPKVKRPRTVDDYKPATLKEIVVEGPRRDGFLPLRVRVIYTGSARRISKTSNDAKVDWARCCAGNPDHYKGYVSEMQFVENGEVYWLAVEDKLIADSQKELKAGETVDLFLIRLSAPVTNGKRGSVLIVERFQRVGTNGDQPKQPLNWIVSNLPSYAEKDLKVEVPASCRLKITDSSRSAGVSKAVVWIPLIDLDLSRVNVGRQHSNGGWALGLHTTGDKNSIRFMLYQGSPAEGGQASKYSLTFRDRENAEAMAEAFRRAIKLCTTAKTLPSAP